MFTASKFPLYRQHDAMQCGVACLRMVCAHFGRQFSMEELSELCPTTSEGVSMLGISRAAEELGLHTACGRLTVDVLATAPLPCILHWNQNHFVVLHRISGRKGRRTFHVADPAKGRMAYGEDEFAGGWVSTRSKGEDKGIALLLEETPAFVRRNGRQGDGGETRSLTFIFGYARQYRSQLLQVMLGLLVACLLQLALPFLTQSIVDRGIAGKDMGFVCLVLAGQLAITLGGASIDFIRRWLLLHVGAKVNISLVSDFFVKLLRLPMRFFDTKQTGDILQRMADHGRVQTFLTGQALSVAFSVATLAVFGAVLLFYSATLFAVFAAFSAAYAAWIAAFLSRRKALDYCLFEKNAVCQDTTWQMITTMQEIKLQGCRQRRRWEWEDTQVDLFGVQMRSLKLQQAQEAGSLLLNGVKNIVLTVIAAGAVIDGRMTLGMMLAVQYIIGQLAMPVEQLMAFVFSLQDVRTSLERINQVHRVQDEDCRRARRFALPEGSDGGITFEGVGFGYDPDAPEDTLKDICMDIRPGGVTAIVGMSGSGKTTCLKLMLGYYAPSSGHIRIGGADIGEYDMGWWRSQCGVVMQDGVIFSESIARNIAVDDGDIDEGRLLEAARIAHIDRFVEGLPLKYNTRIGRNGMGLSMGQRQRILIARAVYKNPSYLFLDEATNSLDAANEQGIVRELDRFFKGRTVVVIAHRLSTVRHAGCIMVMDQGRIVERGTHEELVEKRGCYYRLVKNQIEL